MLAIACALTSSTVFATARVLVTAQGGASPPDPIVIVDQLVAQAVSLDRGASASAYAALDSGVLRSSTNAVLPQNGVVYESKASATISDNVTFIGAIGGTAFLDYSLDGLLALSGSSALHSTLGQLLVSYSSFGNGSATRNLILSSSAITCPFQAICTVGTEIATSGSIPIPISAGEYTMSVSLITQSQAGDAANFANTARVFLRTPTGVNFTSQSGSFLVNASPVPEPGVVGLFLLGLVTVGCLVKRSASDTRGEA